ncbi:hypothetical protein VW35_08045 [Devosia soli]|uniref:Aldose 1-epimerase n=1 Tax=Devosia soli TaxID=361041 RepID=A0A0F5LFH0_9HYPH|nr:hypothetical protein [Devosia soli]KKB80337.1 hypothetical protein VW35_08045 [Devosia soli]
MTEYRLSWSHGEAVVLSTAAVLADCRFDLPAGAFHPFARAPWMGTVDDPNIIGHLRELGGDFVCVPFGAGPAEPIGPRAWADLMTEPPPVPIHGPAGDAEWSIVEQTESSITLGLDYPENHLVRRLERTVSGHEGSPVLESELTIYPRRSGSISVGLHPILRLPEAPGRLELKADFEFGLVHPRLVGDGESQEFAGLDSVPSSDSSVDLSHLPLEMANFSVQLCGMTGPLRAIFLDQAMGIELDWDRAILPSLQIWYTDCGIDGAPWHGQYRGVGVEPIASAFDLNTAVSTQPNPINRRGVPTAVALNAGVPVHIRHRVSAFSVKD